MSAHVCERCHVHTNLLDIFERRIEYRSVYKQRRFRTVVTGRVCRGCVEDEVLGLRGAPPLRQGRLDIS